MAKNKCGLCIENVEIMKFWNWDKNKILELDPYKLTQGSAKKAIFNCRFNHEWQAKIAHVFSGGSFCPFCAQHLAGGADCLAITHPDLCKELVDKIDGEKYISGADQKVWWTCLVGHGNYYTRIVSRTRTGSGCPKCAKNWPHNDNLQSTYNQWLSKKSQRTRELEYGLSFDEWKIIVLQNCHYCGQAPNQPARRPCGPLVNGIDRVNNDIGYNLENSIPCCGDCNFLKGQFSQSKFFEQCKKITIYQNNLINNDLKR